MGDSPQPASKLLDRLHTAGKTPTPPGVVLRLLELTRNPDADLRIIADTIAMDPALAAKILRFVNSPLAGVSREVISLQHAVALVGMRAVKMMALSFAVISHEGVKGCKGYQHDRFVLFSLACGVAAQRLAILTRSVSPQEAFVAGLLSQLGWSVLARAIPAQYAQVMGKCRRIPRDLPQVEQVMLGETYPIVTGALLRAWGLPEGLCAAILAFRNEPVEGETLSMSTILNVAEAAAVMLAPVQSNQPEDASEFIRLASAALGLDHEECVAALQSMLQELEMLRQLFEIPAGHLPGSEELESRVRESIAELGVAMHLENKTLATQQEDLLRRATTDPLTGIGNRAAFDARLSLELERSARFGNPVGLIMIDVDHFKAFNDTHGHLAGDRVLQTVGNLLDDNVRKVDYVARFGGEEFAVIAPSTETEGLLLLAERLRAAVEGCAVPWESRRLKVTISVGVALLTNVIDVPEAARNLIIAADRELYAAKCRGRNCVSFDSRNSRRPVRKASANAP